MYLGILGRDGGTNRTMGEIYLLLGNICKSTLGATVIFQTHKLTTVLTQDYLNCLKVCKRII